MVDADQAAPVALARRRPDRGHVDQRHPVMLVVIGQEGEHRVLVLDLAVEHGLVPGDHLVEAARAIDHMDEARRADA